MNDKGFTLIELLGTLVILSIVGTLGTLGIIAIKNHIDETLFESKKELILNGAVLYGEDNINVFNESCQINQTNYSCLKISILNLIQEDGNYLSTDDMCEEQKCIVNNITKENINEEIIYIYQNNGLVKAIFESDI